MAKNVPLINGQEYNHANVKISLGGVLLWGVVSIDYNEDQPKDNLYGAGENPVSRGKQAKNPSASIELLMSEVEKLRDSAPGRNLNNLPAFDIVVSYLNVQKFVVHTLKNAEFTTDGGGTSQGDAGASKSFDLVLSGIKYS